LLLSFKESFFFLTSNKLLNKCLKCLKRLEVLLGTFRESNGTSQWPHTNRPPPYRGGSIDSGEVLPSIYKRNLREDICRKYFERGRTAPKTDSHFGAAWPGRGPCQGSRPLRGAQSAALTQAFPPGPFLRHVGNVQVWPQERPQCPRPRPRPPRSWSRPTWGVFSGCGAGV
jgi:hypothetical protein